MVLPRAQSLDVIDVTVLQHTPLQKVPHDDRKFR